ncbi:MAG TPA: YiiX/YebB-like N1pC/P60 family cysteine hydrolase [Thermoanaerobaculia bacterium]|nr:YiiX/YebB-like N1pC/P60 family cysteine hydrolase [Thermoanaerobaculia bacterium]
MSSNGDSANPAMHFALAGLAAALLVLLPPHRLAPAQVARIEVDPSSVLPGDLVFRRGRSMISRAVLSIDGKSEFSHVGIALSEGRIVHAVPPEEDNPGGVVEDALETFLTPELASAAAVYRPSDPGIGFRAAARAWEYARRRRPFDSGFDLSTPGAVYCTELVWRAYLEEGVDLAGRDFKERYLLPSHLLASSDLRLIQEYR